MKQSLKKTIFYMTFIAIGIYFAEVVSTNLPNALMIPIVYPAYGLLYIFFIDSLIRYDCHNIRIWYVFGALVGIITETYVAKVTFYGAEMDGFVLFGISPGAVLFIILFYHAFFSFIIPAYFAKSALNMPIPMKKRKWLDYSFVTIPFLLIPIAIKKMVAIGLVPMIKLTGISALIFLAWTLILRYIGNIQNILLTKKEKISLFILTIAIYAYYLIFGANDAHGHAPLDFPIIPMLTVSLLIVAYLVLNLTAIKKNSKEAVEVAYNPRDISLKIVLGWLVWHITAITVLLVFFAKIFLPLVNVLIVLLSITGILIAIYFFITSTLFLIKKFIQ